MPLPTHLRFYSPRWDFSQTLSYWVQHLYSWSFIWQFAPLQLPLYVKQSLQELQAKTRGTLLIVQHNDALDNHIIAELCRQVRIPIAWPATTARFLNRPLPHVLAALNAYSVQPGKIIDRLAWKHTQTLLAEGHTVLIMPDCLYTPTVRLPLSSDIAAFALATAKKMPLQIQQLTFQLRFMHRPDWPDIIASLQKRLHRAAEGDVIPLPELILNPQANIWIQLQELMMQGLYYLEVVYHGLPIRKPIGLSERLDTLRQYILKTMSFEHLREAVSETFTLSEQIKRQHQLEGEILSKRNAPPLIRVQADLETVLIWQKHLAPWHPRHQKHLERLEQTWLGDRLPSVTLKRRLSRLHFALTRQLPYAVLRDNATFDDFGRWDNQYLDLKRVLLMALLKDDFQRQDTTDESIASTITKLERLLLNQQTVYGKRDIQVSLAKPLSMSDFLEQHHAQKPHQQRDILSVELLNRTQ